MVQRTFKCKVPIIFAKLYSFLYRSHIQEKYKKNTIVRFEHSENIRK